MKSNEENNRPANPGRLDDVNRKENILSNQRNDRSAKGTDNEGEVSNEPTFVGTPGEIGSASLGGSFDDERGGGTSGRGGNDGGTMSIRNDNAAHTNDHGTSPNQLRGNQQNNMSQGSNPSGNNERG